MDEAGRWRMRRPSGLPLVAAALWSIGLVVASVVVPAYGSSSASSSGVVASGSATLVEENGLRVLAPICLPLLAVASVWIALGRRKRRAKSGAGVLAWTMTAAVVVVSMLGMLTIGVFILPVAVLLVVACLGAPSPPRTGGRPA